MLETKEQECDKSHIKHGAVARCIAHLSPRVPSHSLLRHRDFVRFWSASSLTSLGGQISMLALPLTAVSVLEATPSQMGVMVALQTLPFALFSLHAGVWIDRHRKLPIILINEILVAGVLVLIPLLAWLGALSMGWMYVIAFAIGVSFVVTGTASQVFITQLVGRDQVLDAMSKFTATDSAAKLAGPGIAGSLIHWLGAPYAVAIDALAFLGSFALIRRIRHREPPIPVRADSTVWGEIREGWQVVRGNSTLWSLAIGAALWNLLFQGYQAVIMIFAARTLGLSAGQIGAAHIAGGLGALLAAISARHLTRRWGLGPPILMGLGVTALAWAVLAMLPANQASPWATLAASLFLLDFGVTLYIIHYLSLRQAITPDALLGRMTATMRFLSVAGAPIGALAAGAIAEAAGLRAALAGCAVACATLFAVLWFVSPVRHVRDVHPAIARPQPA